MTTSKLLFRDYTAADLQRCLDLFDANCPKFLDPSERGDYLEFLRSISGLYEVAEIDGKLVCAFGVSDGEAGEKRLNWILVDPEYQGQSAGAAMVARAMQKAKAEGGETLGLATSQMVAPFFEKFGGTIVNVEKNGFGDNIDRVDMVIAV